MATPVEQLKNWFESLPRVDQKDVLRFLYDKRLITEGMFCGPAPEFVPLTKGLFCGPVPTSVSASRCPTCGRPL